MHKKRNYFIILLILAFFSVSFVSAGEVNDTSLNEINHNASIDLDSLDDVSLGNASEGISNGSIEKTNPVVSLKSNKVKAKDTLVIYLKNSSGNPLKSKNLTLNLNDKKYYIFTDSNGTASINVNLPAKSYELNVTFAEDDEYKSLSKTFRIKISKLNTELIPNANVLLKGRYLYVDLSSNNNLISSKKVSIKINGKTYVRKTNKNGRAGIKIGLDYSTYSVLIRYGGNGYYKSSKLKFDLKVMQHSLINIGNTKLLTNGYLRIYLKGNSVSEISQKTLKIKIADKKFTAKTNSEGIVVLKSNMEAKKYKVIVKYGKYWTSKKVRGINGNVKDPLKENIALKNGIPDIDLMPQNYVMGDGSATYTLTKAQYKEVIKRDSYCLFLNNKLSKYTFFKTKSNPNTNHRPFSKVRKNSG